MNEVSNFLQSVSGPKYNLGLLNSSPNISPIVGLNGYEKTQDAQSVQAPNAQSAKAVSAGPAYSGSLIGNPTAVNDAVSQGIQSFGNGRSSGWDGTSGTTGIGQGATTEANQGYYTNKALGDFATGMSYTPMGAFKALAKNAVAYGMNNSDLLGAINDPNNGYGDPISALAAIQGWSDNGVSLSSPSMAANPMQQDPATRQQQQALAAALTGGGGNSSAPAGSDTGNGGHYSPNRSGDF
jgi:hypothetical protein